MFFKRKSKYDTANSIDQINQLIDLHNHTLFGVDDGPKDIELSLAMLKDAASQGISSIILTPHYRNGMFRYDMQAIQQNTVALKERCVTEGIDIQLFPGCEYHVNDKIFEHISSGRVSTLAESDYVLTEYKYDTAFEDIAYHTERLCSCSYIPVIAHAERYHCIQKKPKLCGALQEMGAWIQCNAVSILGKEGSILEKTTEKLLKNRWVDVVASDSHDMEVRKNYLRPAADYICNKYGATYAKELFYSNPLKIIT